MTINCKCGTRLSNESLELRKTFPRLPQTQMCDKCLKTHETTTYADQVANDFRIKRAAIYNEIVPSAMRRTDENHPLFNKSLFNQVRKSYKASSNKWVGIIGARDSCKTRVLSLIAKGMILNGIGVVWTDAIEFQHHIHRLNISDSKINAVSLDFLNALKKTEVLMIDDIGRNSWSASFERELYGVVNYRYMADKKVIWVSRKHPMDFVSSKIVSSDAGISAISRLISCSAIVESL